MLPTDADDFGALLNLQTVKGTFCDGGVVSCSAKCGYALCIVQAKRVDFWAKDKKWVSSKGLRKVRLMLYYIM